MKKLITIMASAAVLLFASQLYAAPVDLISAGSSGWEYRTIGGFAHQNLANNFWSLNCASVNWTTFWTGQAAFGNTQATAGQSALGNWLDGQGLYLPSQTNWSWQTALVLKKTFTVVNPALVSDISLNVASDNGFIIWINNGNNEVARSLDDGAFTSYWEFSNLSFSPSFLTAGTNTLYALAIDDAPPQTWDATFFDLQLTANAVPVPTAIILFASGLAAIFGIKRWRE